MRGDGRPHQRQAEAGTAGLATARGFQPPERLEHPLQFVLRDAGTVVVDGDDQLAAASLQANAAPDPP